MKNKAVSENKNQVESKKKSQAESKYKSQAVSKKGFTLVEIIVALMLVSLTAIAATALIRTTMVVFYKNEDLNNAKLAAQRALEYISDTLYSADTVTISPPTEPSGKNSIKASGGKLYLDGQDWFCDSIPAAKTIRSTIMGTSKVIMLAIDVLNSDGTVCYSCEKTFTLNNMKLKEDKNILWNVEQGATEWQIVYANPEPYSAEL
ncbi:MAG: type II secretion system protein [Oscillospiraceae bacterium]